jgi:hypothetical protein
MVVSFSKYKALSLKTPPQKKKDHYSPGNTCGIINHITILRLKLGDRNWSGRTGTGELNRNLPRTQGGDKEVWGI